MTRFVFFLSFFFLINFLVSQNLPIGDWDLHLNYTNTNTMISKNNKIYVGTKSGLFYYNTDDNSVTKFSKLDGLSSMDITALAVNDESGSILVGYQDGNLDIVLSNNTINIPYIASSSIIGDKKINHIFIDGNVAYISCPFGLVLFDLAKLEVKETVYLSDDGTKTHVFETHVFDGDIYTPSDNFLANKIFVGTDKGLFYIDKNSNLLDYSAWKRDSRITFALGNKSATHDLVGIEVVNVVGFDKKINGGKRLLIGTNIDYSKIIVPWLGLVEYNLFQFNTIAYMEPFSPSLNMFVASTDVPGSILNLSYNPIAEKGCVITNDLFTEKIILLGECADCFDQGTLINVLSVNSTDIGNTDLSLAFVSGLVANDFNDSKTVFLGTRSNGLVFSKDNNYQNLDVFEFIYPNGPAGINIGSISGKGNNIVLSHGAKVGSSWNNLYNKQEISFYNSYWSRSTTLIDLELYDAVSTCFSIDPDHCFVGTWNSGLLEFYQDSLINHYTPENTGGMIQGIDGTESWARIGGIDVDQNNVLWATNSQVDKPLLRLENGTWTNFSVPNLPSSIMSGKILCTKNNQKWIQLREQGLLVAREGKNGIESRRVGSGNGLPSQNVNCFVEDDSGSIWVGTSQGLAVFYFPEEIFNNSSYSADYILIETEDGYVERLFENTEILDIAIDGGNRKWVGTKSNGAFLISEDGTSQVYNFTKENSPLLDNEVSEISILGPSGEVFFATGSGVCSYRSSASESKNNFNNVLVFPNPVRKNYSGDIAISGLTKNTTVKITDISGNLVFETTSEGGTATWDGYNFDGKRVSTGVYLFFCTSPDFNESIIKKILIYN